MSADQISRYLAVKEGGASPQQVYSATKADGLRRPEAIKILRSLYNYSLAEAKAIVSSVDGPGQGEFPKVSSHKQLINILRDELGYCECASQHTLLVLRDFLQAAQDRSDAVNDREAFSQASRALEACLPLEAASGLVNWFVYGLEQRGLIWHGFRLTDAWITDKGRWLLEAIKRLPPPRDDP
jgi:hypothetical protein